MFNGRNVDPQFPPAEQRRRFGFCWDEVGSFGPYMDFWSFYELLVKAAPPGSTIVELGCYHGQGLCVLGLFAKEADKGLKIVGIDNNSVGASPSCRGNLAMAKLDGVVQFIDGDSAASASLFADNSVWACFIDAGHTHELVDADVKAWMPKVSHWLTGHDFLMFPVHQPILAMFPTTTIYDERWQDIWIVAKQDLPGPVDIRAVPEKYPEFTTWQP